MDGEDDSVLIVASGSTSSESDHSDCGVESAADRCELPRRRNDVDSDCCPGWHDSSSSPGQLVEANDPFRRVPALDSFPVAVLSRQEAYAEKLRAALSRREPAIRDHYDVDHAFRTGRIQPQDGRLVDLVRQKLAVPGNEPIDFS